MQSNLSTYKNRGNIYISSAKSDLKACKCVYYILDATGNQLAVYERVINNQAQTVTFEHTEKTIYGSSRLGVLNCKINLLGSAGTAPYSQTNWTHRIGQRNFELSNHLNNVLSVISDKPIPHPSGGTVDYYMADIMQSSDYSAFHAPLSGRTLSKTGNSKDYRFGGSNGQEKTDELSGKGNHYTAEYWEYDARLGRRWNLDPVVKPHRSPYDVFSNNPIIMVDPNGDDDYYNSDGTYNTKMSKKFNDNGTHNIYVLSPDGKSKYLLADMPLKTESDRKIVEKVMSGYAKKAGVWGKVNLEKGSKKSDKNPAFTNTETYQVSINYNGGHINELLSDYHNLENTLYHERLHQENTKNKIDDNDELFNGLLQHNIIYLKQFEHKSFNRTSKDFKRGSFNYFEKKMNDLEKLVLSETVDGKELDKLADRFNKGAGKKWGYSISAQKEGEGYNTGEATKRTWVLKKN